MPIALHSAYSERRVKGVYPQKKVEPMPKVFLLEAISHGGEVLLPSPVEPHNLPKEIAENLINRGLASVESPIGAALPSGADSSEELASETARADQAEKALTAMEASVARADAVADALTAALNEKGGDAAAVIKAAVKAHDKAVKQADG